MNLNVLAPLALLALIAASAPTGSTGTFGHPVNASVAADADALDARIAKLEKQVATLTAENAATKAHVHSYFATRVPSQYMSLHDIAIAITPHSSTDTTAVWVPTYASSSPIAAGGIRQTTSVPTAGP